MSMEDYFGAEEYQAPQSTYLPPQQEDDAFDFSASPATSFRNPPSHAAPSQPQQQFDFTNYGSTQPTAVAEPEGEDGFNDFEEDETTRRIRE
jgi:hypothetical protein